MNLLSLAVESRPTFDVRNGMVDVQHLAAGFSIEQACNNAESVK